MPGTALPTAPRGRLAHDPHFADGKTETQRGDVTCHTAQKCPDCVILQLHLLIPSLICPSTFLRVPPRSQGHAPAPSSQLPLSLGVTCMPAGLEVGLWPLHLGSVCFLSLPQVLTKSGRTLDRTRFTKLSTRLGRSLRREEWGEEGLVTRFHTRGPNPGSV